MIEVSPIAQYTLPSLRQPGSTIYNRIDTMATINFSTQFGAATIRERSLFRSAQVQAEKTP